MIKIPDLCDQAKQDKPKFYWICQCLRPLNHTVRTRRRLVTAIKEDVTEDQRTLQSEELSSSGPREMLGTCLGWMPSGTSGLSGGKRLPELTLQGLAGSPTGIPHGWHTDPAQHRQTAPFPLWDLLPQVPSTGSAGHSQHLCLPCTCSHPSSQLPPQNDTQIAFDWSFIPSQILHNSEKPSKAHNCP